MKTKNIIFTAGLLENDDYLMEHVKEWRGDILVEDEYQNYFELTFITISRLSSELKNKSYATEEWGWIVVNSLNVNVITETIKSLTLSGYFATQKPKLDIKPQISWTVVAIN